jgi:hypothetical protein
LTGNTRKRGSRDETLISPFLLTAPPQASRATFWHDDVTSLTLSRWARLAGWKRLTIRWIVAPAALVAVISAYLSDHAGTLNAAGAVAAGLACGLTRHTASRLRHWRFRAMYVRPLAHALAPVLGENPWTPDRWIRVSRDLAGLAARLARPMSPAEVAVRRWYGTRVQPIVRWLPEHVMRVWWSLHTRCEPIRNRLDYFRKPTEARGPRVEIAVRAGMATRVQRELIRDVIPAKLGLDDLVESWDQVGPCPIVCYVVRERPPTAVGLAEILPYLATLAEPEFVVGLTTGNRPVVISLDDDAPHFACSAGSGAGKSVLAKLLAVQVLMKGGHVTILDRKGSHRWARNLPGVTYCTKPADMHRTLIELAQLADQRNDQALDEEEGWDPGRREFLIFEEMNATVAQLRQYWDEVRGKGDPKASPGISAFRNVMFMGRSAKMNLFGVAQMLTANTTGGPEARENFGVRALARYTANNWKMLCPETPMPRKSRVRGRWQFVIAGESTETQVAFLSDAEVWGLIESVPVSPSPRTTAAQGGSSGTEPTVDTITLREAHERFCPGINFETLKKRRQRARTKGGAGPKIAAMRGRDETYTADEIRQWLEAESLLSMENRND